MPLSRFNSLFSRTAAPNLIRQFGETVTYYPSGSATGREIMAIVDRTEMPRISIRVRNATCDGIASDEIDTGGDEVAVSLRIGETPKRRAVQELLDDSNGFTRFLCE